MDEYFDDAAAVFQCLSAQCPRKMAGPCPARYSMARCSSTKIFPSPESISEISALHPPHDKQGVEKAAGDGFFQMLDLIDGNVVFSGDHLQNLRAIAGDTALLGQPAGNLRAAASVFAFDGEIVAFHGEVVLSYKKWEALALLRRLLKLTVVEFRVESVLCQQLLVGAALDDVAVFQYENQVRVFDGDRRWAMTKEVRFSISASMAF